MGNVLWIIILAVLVVAVAVMSYLYWRQREQSKRYRQRLSVQKVSLHSMGHEIRTALNAICGFSQILGNEQLRSMLSEKEVAEYDVIIQNNVDLLNALLKNFIAIVDKESA